MNATLPKDAITLRIPEMRRVFARNRGAAAQLARDLSVAEGTISRFLRGKVDSKRILEAARRRTLELINQRGTARGLK